MTTVSESVATATSQPEHYNRPGLPALAYRAGTHPTFLRRMFDRLLTQTLEAEARPLTHLKTREPDDPAIALLDAWATAADVLTFYQERIANEGYLRTATERRSVLELARAIGYELQPGVAASALLAFRVEEPDEFKMKRTVTVPAGTKVQSIPGQGQMPQTFETSAEITARYDWNELRPLALEGLLEKDVMSLALDRKVEGLQSGQLLALSGEWAGVPAQSVSEIVTLDHTSDNNDVTTLFFQDRLQYRYLIHTVTFNANVARATHGETTREVLGSGDGAQPNQRFTLKRRSLTYLSAPTPSGAQSALEVRVNAVRWDEAPSLHGLNSGSKSYQVSIEDDGATHITFGDGQSGARLSSGLENVSAIYRTGLGPEGEVEARTLSLLQTRPLGIRSVTNPLPASGAAPPDDIERARAKAPLNVLTVDRLVSLRDYEHFARAFAGIRKAQAVSLWNGQTPSVHLTIAGVGGATIGKESDLYHSLLKAIRALHDPTQAVQIDSCERRYFNVKANVWVEPHHQAAVVFAAIRAALLQTFSFEQRSFGQPVAAAEVIAVIQRVPGVIAVDLDALYPVDLNSLPPTDQPPPLIQLLSAELATWDAAEKQSRAAELLMVNPMIHPALEGITLNEMKP